GFPGRRGTRRAGGAGRSRSGRAHARHHPPRQAPPRAPFSPAGPRVRRAMVPPRRYATSPVGRTNVARGKASLRAPPLDRMQPSFSPFPPSPLTTWGEGRGERKNLTRLLASRFCAPPPNPPPPRRAIRPQRPQHIRTRRRLGVGLPDLQKLMSG